MSAGALLCQGDRPSNHGLAVVVAHSHDMAHADNQVTLHTVFLGYSQHGPFCWLTVWVLGSVLKPFGVAALALVDVVDQRSNTTAITSTEAHLARPETRKLMRSHAISSRSNSVGMSIFRSAASRYFTASRK
jgi:hypothetical protein